MNFTVPLKHTKISPFLGYHQLKYKHLRIETKRFCHSVIPPNDANGIANSEEPDQTAPPRGAV